MYRSKVGGSNPIFIVMCIVSTENMREKKMNTHLNKERVKS
jgi:hypothetical protein